MERQKRTGRRTSVTVETKNFTSQLAERNASLQAKIMQQPEASPKLKKEKTKKSSDGSDTLAALVASMNTRLERFEAETQRMSTRLSHVEAETQCMSARLSHVETETHDLKQAVQELNDKVQLYQQRIDRLAHRSVIDGASTVTANTLNTSRNTLGAAIQESLATGHVNDLCFEIRNALCSPTAISLMLDYTNSVRFDGNRAAHKFTKQEALESILSHPPGGNRRGMITLFIVLYQEYAAELNAELNT